MKCSSILAAVLLPLTVLAKKPANDVFTTFQSKQVSAAKSLKLDDQTYHQLTKSPRNHSVTVLLTALDDRFTCALCKVFQPEWDLLAKSWIKGDKKGESRLIFGTLDFMDGKEVFQALKLQTAPVLVHFPPTTGPNAKPDGEPVRFDFSPGIETAEAVHAWLSRQLPSGPHPKFVRPFNYIKLAFTVTGVLGVITFVSLLYPYVLPIIQNRNLWAAISLISVLLFTSGQMYNHIRKVPYIASDGKGGLSYIAGGFQNQFGLETQIIAGLYGLLSFATISLALKVPRMADSRSQQIAVFLWAAVLLGTYSFLLSIFRIKNGGYPFWLPPF